MPAWITSLLRELVSVPIADCASRIGVSRPRSAMARATANPTTPAPMTTHSIDSLTSLPADTVRPWCRNSSWESALAWYATAGYGARSVHDGRTETRYRDVGA